ncbi:unnamed protein product [Symbiodinium pilosum]|uniref:Uncharacterized protein n=1 Tax=Symbiodinium pilosum TaxID=2952 RepID=A0A812T3U4_SYMPI|nr:unnamed protein product [Symbiodinium pilosum]
MDFIDPESVKIAFRIRNNDATLGLFQRAAHRRHFRIREELLPAQVPGMVQPARPRRASGKTLGATPWRSPPASTGTVLMAPTLIGLFQSGKMLPPQLNLVLEIEFAEAGDALRPAGGTSDFSIESVRLLASQVTLDSALVESFNKVLLSGRSLVFSYTRRCTQGPARSSWADAAVAAIATALAPFETAAQRDAARSRLQHQAAIAAAVAAIDLSPYNTSAQTDAPSRSTSRAPFQNNTDTLEIDCDSVSSPRQIRGILPRAPLAWSYLFSGTITELRCDAYSKAEADGRCLSSTGFTTALDGRLVTNANGGRPWATVTELTCDAWSKTEADGRYATAGAILAVDARVTALENSGGVPADISCASLTASTAVKFRTTTRVDALFTQNAQTSLLRPISTVDHLHRSRPCEHQGGGEQRHHGAGPVCGAEVHMRVGPPADHRRRVRARYGVLTNAALARIGDDSGVTVLGSGLAVAGVAWPPPKCPDR